MNETNELPPGTASLLEELESTSVWLKALACRHTYYNTLLLSLSFRHCLSFLWTCS